MDSFVSSSRFRRSYASMTSIPPSPTFPTVHSGPGSGISARQDAKKRTNESGGPDETGVTTSFRFAREHLRTGTAVDCPRSLSPSRPNGALGTYPEGEGVFDSPELDMALRTPQTLGHWSSSSTIEEDDEDSNRAAYTITKELGRSSTQVGQRLLDATMRNKTLVSFTLDLSQVHTVTTRTPPAPGHYPCRCSLESWYRRR